MRNPYVALLLVLSFSPFALADDPLATLRPGHPRLLLSEPDIPRLKALRQTDVRFDRLAREIEGDARTLLKESPVQYKKTGRRLLTISRLMLQRVLVLGLAYELSGDEVYAHRAETEMLAVAAFGDWNPSHFLDVGEMTAAMAIGYDWFYDTLKPETRAVFRRAIVEKGLRQSLDAKAPHNSWQQDENNWVQVCYGGLSLGALAIAEDEPELAAQILARARAGIGRGLKPYAPDGVYPEGPGYWSYGTTYQVMMIAGLESALGTDWGLKSSPGFLASAHAYAETTGPTGKLFNYSDGQEAGSAQPALLWFARVLNDPSILQAQKPYFPETPSEPSSRRPVALERKTRFQPLALLWWPPAGAFSAEPNNPRFWQGRGPNPLVVYRSSWTDPAALYLALKGGSAGLNHAHMDAGSFVLEADGVRWACDLGMQDYESL
jgi:hypothetical protein